MKKFTLFFLTILITSINQINAQPCNADNILFGNAQENPFGLVDNGVNDFTVIHLLDVNNDGLDDVFVTDIICLGPACSGGVQSETRYFVNTGGDSPSFSLDTIFEDSKAPFGWPGMPNVDIDSDGDMDIVRGFFFEIVPEFEPGDSTNIRNVVFYKNKAVENGNSIGFDFANSAIEVNPWNIEIPDDPISGTDLVLIWPNFADLDGDGDLDMFLGGFFPGQGNPAYHYFENIGTATEPNFEGDPLVNPFGLELPLNFNHYSRLVDIDCDGDLDMFTTFANASASIYFHENIGTPTSPQFSCTPVLWPDLNFDVAYGAFTDLDCDGDLDAFTGDDIVRYYENNTHDLNCADLSPKADFTFVMDDLTITFTNNSTGEIDGYFWDFGDGTTSNEQNPQHTYAMDGNYEICLSVSCNTYCEPIMITVAVNESNSNIAVSLFPNPVKDRLLLAIKSDRNLGETTIEIYDAVGKSVLIRYILMEDNSMEELLELTSLARGIYTLRINSESQAFARKFLKW